MVEGILVVGHAVLFLLDVEEDELVAGLLEFGGDDMVQVAHADGEGAEGGRHVNVVEGAAHGVLAADGGQLEAHLGVVGAEEGGEGLAPTVGVAAQLLEVFLEGEAHTAGVATDGGNLGHRAEDGVDSAVEGTPRHEVGVEAVGHDADGVALAVEQRQLGDHALGRRQLVAAAEGHQDAAGTDAAVEHLDEALLGADVQIA